MTEYFDKLCHHLSAMVDLTPSGGSHPELEDQETKDEGWPAQSWYR